MCGGKGTRMLPLTENIPKVLIPINNRPFLYYLLKDLQKAGFNEFGIIVGYKKEKIIQFCEEYNFNATFIEQTELLGTGDAVKRAKDFTGNEQFLVCGGDNLWSVDDFKQLNTNDEFTYVSGYKVSNPELYGVLSTDGDFLTSIVEKPKEFVGDLISTGLYKFTPEIYDALDKIELSPRGEYELTDAIAILADQRKVKVLKLQGYWKDLGKLDDIPTMEKFILDEWKS